MQLTREQLIAWCRLRAGLMREGEDLCNRDGATDEAFGSHMAALHYDAIAAMLESQQNRIAALKVVGNNLRIDANRLCDRNLGGSYEDDCRLAIKKWDEVLFAPPAKVEARS